MTLIQKNITKDMRSSGRSYAEIADWLGLSKNTIKSYCQRNSVENARHRCTARYLRKIQGICRLYAWANPDTNHAVSDVCISTRLLLQAARRLMLLERLKGVDMMNPTSVTAEFDEDAEEAMQLAAFAAATTMTSLLLSTDEGLHILNLLSGIIFGAKLKTESDTPPCFVFMSGHKNTEIEYPLENITAALWVNMQHEAEKIRTRMVAANVGHMDGFDADIAFAHSEQ